MKRPDPNDDDMGIPHYKPVIRKVEAWLCDKYVRRVVDIVDPITNPPTADPTSSGEVKITLEHDKLSGKRPGGSIQDLLYLLPDVVNTNKDFDSHNLHYGEDHSITQLDQFVRRLGSVLRGLEELQYIQYFGAKSEKKMTQSDVEEASNMGFYWVGSKRTLFIPSLAVLKADLQKTMPEYPKHQAYGASWPIVRIFGFQYDLLQLHNEDVFEKRESDNGHIRAGRNYSRNKWTRMVWELWCYC
jgi:hypothetical protein